MICCQLKNGLCRSPFLKQDLPFAPAESYCQQCGFINQRCGEEPRFDSVAAPAVIFPAEGTGTRLREIFRERHIHAEGCGGCGKTLAWMNEIGPDECEKQIDEIKRQIKANKRTADVDWAEVYKQNVADILKLKIWINPLDPLGGFIREAIRRERERLSAI